MGSRNGLKILPGKLSDFNELFSPTKPFCRSFQRTSKLESVKIDFETTKDISNVSINVRPSTTSIIQNSRFETYVRPRTVHPNFPKITSKACRSLLDPAVSKTNLLKKKKNLPALKNSRKNGPTTSRISINNGNKFKIVEVRPKAPSGYMSNFKRTTNTIKIPIVDFTKIKSLVLEKNPFSPKKENTMIGRLKALELLKTPRNIFKPSVKISERHDVPEYFYNFGKIHNNFSSGSGSQNNWKYIK